MGTPSEGAPTQILMYEGAVSRGARMVHADAATTTVWKATVSAVGSGLAAVVVIVVVTVATPGDLRTSCTDLAARPGSYRGRRRDRGSALLEPVCVRNSRH
jgi:hypothetical protein